MSDNNNRIYQLTNEQLNVISADLLEAIVLISGKKDETGLLDELNDINENLVDYLSKNKNIVQDLDSLFQKVKADEKLKVKIKEIEINQLKENDLIAKIENYESATKSLNSSTDMLQTTCEMLGKNVVLSSNKIKDDVKAIETSTNAIKTNIESITESITNNSTNLKTEAEKFEKIATKIDENILKSIKKSNILAYIGVGFISFTIGIFFTLSTVYTSVGKLSFNNILMQILG